MRLSGEFLEQWFGVHDEKCTEEDKAMCDYAKKPYESHGEYMRDKKLLEQHNTSAKPQDKFLLIHAAKVERTPAEKLETLRDAGESGGE